MTIDEHIELLLKYSQEYQGKLEPLKKIDQDIIDSALETHHHQVELLTLILKLNR
jgi:hypothetical protein